MSVTYEDVAAICEELSSQGKKPTIREVRTIAKANNNVVQEFYNQWEKQKSKASKINHAVSPGLTTAILAEISSATQDMRESFSKELNNAEMRLSDFMTIIAELEAKEASLIQQLCERDQTIETQSRAHQKEITVCQERLCAANLRAEERERERNAAVQALEFSRTETAKAQLQVERADECAQKAECRVTELEQKLDDLRNAMAIAEQKAAVAESRGDHLQEQLIRCEDWLVEEKSLSRSLAARLEEARGGWAEAQGKASVYSLQLASARKNELQSDGSCRSRELILPWA